MAANKKAIPEHRFFISDKHNNKHYRQN